MDAACHCRVIVRFALVFASWVVALSLVGELRDITFCHVAAENAAGRMSKWTRVILTAVNVIRRFSLLPAMNVSVLLMVANRGGDALSVW
eukprot:SAG22_NODE_45_length_24718_cov_12.462448_7_plen_90_part_00